MTCENASRFGNFGFVARFVPCENGNRHPPLARCRARPDIGILCYPVITMGEFTLKVSHDILLGTRLSLRKDPWSRVAS